jgi:hypothetical protein
MQFPLWADAERMPVGTRGNYNEVDSWILNGLI